MLTDDWGAETAWILLREDGENDYNQLMEGATYETLEDNTHYEESVSNMFSHKTWSRL